MSCTDPGQRSAGAAARGLVAGQGARGSAPVGRARGVVLRPRRRDRASGGQRRLDDAALLDVEPDSAIRARTRGRGHHRLGPGPAQRGIGNLPPAGLSRSRTLDSSARLIHVSVDRSPRFRQQTVVLGPWQRASFSVTYHTGGKRSACTPRCFSAYGLQVIPPDSTQRLLYYQVKRARRVLGGGGPREARPRCCGPRRRAAS
jgi:hypothetical protein